MFKGFKKFTISTSACCLLPTAANLRVALPTYWYRLTLHVFLLAQRACSTCNEYKSISNVHSMDTNIYMIQRIEKLLKNLILELEATPPLAISDSNMPLHGLPPFTLPPRPWRTERTSHTGCQWCRSLYGTKVQTEKFPVLEHVDFIHPCCHDSFTRFLPRRHVPRRKPIPSKNRRHVNDRI